MQSIATIFGLCLFATQGSALFLGMNASSRSGCAQNPNEVSYGKDKCRCIGIDNLKGYFATQEDFHHVQRPAETGASCAAWEDGLHPKCKGNMPPQWCKQEWCYVDPCSCGLDVLPKQTTLGLTYQGSAAYWSYSTCGSTDFFSADLSDACVNQKNEGACGKLDKCAWDGNQCGGKEVLKTCKEAAKKDEAVHGDDDCRCIGLAGRGAGKSFMHIDEQKLVEYPANVGSTCEAWEGDTHPDCLKDGDKPAWCSSKWCFVDPCKCKTASPPLAVMPANSYMRFQGKTAYWSYATCGSKDTWSSSHKGKYCISQKTEKECSKLDKCAWNGKDCLGKALVSICEKQEASGVLGMESPLPSGTFSIVPMKSLIVVLFAFAWAQ